LDAVFLVSLYAGYVVILLRGETPHEPQLGVAGYLQGFGRGKRIATVLAMFAYSGLIILIAVKPFAKGLEVLGPKIGLSPFFMIQWVAPLASESPEFIACACLVHKPRTTSAFNALISSKLNQWTLLIGTLVVVYSLSLGSYGVLSSTRSRLPRYSSRQRRACSPSVCFNSEMSVRGTSPSSLSSPSGFYQSSRVTRGYSRTASSTSYSPRVCSPSGEAGYRRSSRRHGKRQNPPLTQRWANLKEPVRSHRLSRRADPVRRSLRRRCR